MGGLKIEGPLLLCAKIVQPHICTLIYSTVHCTVIPVFLRQTIQPEECGLKLKVHGLKWRDIYFENMTCATSTTLSYM